RSTPRPAEDFELLKLIPAKLRFHDLRHTVASVLLSQGQSVRAVSQRLGHSNPALTLRVYAHCMPSYEPQLAAALGRMLAWPRDADWLQVGYSSPGEVLHREK